MTTTLPGQADHVDVANVEWAPCRGCGTQVPMVPDTLTTRGLVCMKCAEAPGQVGSTESWLRRRRDELVRDLREVDALLAKEPSA